MVAQGGFKPPVPRGLPRAEFGPSLARYSVRQEASVLERVLFAWDFGSASALSGSLCSPRLNADHGELLMLGIEVAESTVGRYMVRRRQPPSRVGRLSCPITRPRHTARDALAAGTSGLVGAAERRVAKL